MKKFYALLTMAFTVSACVQAVPIVSDYNGASVKIQASAFASAEDAKTKTQAEATRICAKTGKRAEYASTTTNQNTYVSEHLYLCL